MIGGTVYARTGAKHFNFQRTTKNTREFRTWFRGEYTNFNPSEAQMIPSEAASKFVLHGWEPEEPQITPETQITAFGSCFAVNISNWLSKRNFRVLNKDEDAKNAYVVTCGEGMVNSFVIRQQFEWAWENKTFDEALWHGYKAEEYGYDPKIQAETKRIFDETDFFILTFGLSEVWYDEETSNVFWRTIPKDVYDPKRHKFRVSTVEENKENLTAIYDLIRKHRPNAKILFTLSPIPLIATFRDNSCLTSNSVSKAVLRVAIDEVVREKEDQGYLNYWPSYELVTDVFKLPYNADRRHPKGPVLDYIMTLFEHTWCVETDKPRLSLTEAWVKAGATAGLLPEDLYPICADKRIRKLLRYANSKTPLSDDDAKDKAYRKMFRELVQKWRNEKGAAIAAAAATEAVEEGANVMVEIIESRGVKIPFYPEIVTPNIERPMRRNKYKGGECLAVETVVGKGDRVLELGTGVGLVSTKAAMAAGVEQVLTFEANPALIPIIRETHQLNGVTGKIEVINGVVTRGEAPAKLKFYRRADFWGSSVSPVPDKWVDEVDVNTHDLDHILEVMKPTVIVADIEGGELDLFIGADLSSARYVIMEIHPRVYGAEGVKRIFDAMSEMGFGYCPKISRGGTVITFERVGKRRVEAVSSFKAPTNVAPKKAKKQKAKAGAPKVLVPTCMKNEGPYILEWIAYNRAMGVTDFLVFSNDCEDGTVEILNYLQDLGYLTHLPNPAPLVARPYFQPIALKYTQMTRNYAEADYVISMDVDEYLNIRVGEGTIPALLNHMGDVDVISLCEQFFGYNGREAFEPGFVTEQFTRCSSLTPRRRRARRGVKSLLRRESGLTLKNHRPHSNDRVSFDEVIWVDGSGNTPPAEFVHDFENGMDCRGRFDVAWLNHYPLRSMDSFLLKRDRGDVVIKDRKVSVRYWKIRNQNEFEDLTLQRFLPAARKQVDKWMKDPVLAELQKNAEDWHISRVAELRKMPEYQDFLGEISARS